ncbi:MAG: hypothetical protein ACKVTZ_02980 [Bacteroidia bacterium]
MQKRNHFDLFVEEISKSFKFENLDKISDNPKGMVLFTTIITKLAEFQELKNLFKRDFLPAVSRSIVASKRELHNSKYKKLLLEYISNGAANEMFNETVRLGYIALYHKYESFVTLVIKAYDNFYEEEFTKKESIKAFAKREFQVEKWPLLGISIDRIRWISNCVKHTDAFPIHPHDPAFINHPKDKKLVLSKDELMQDMDIVHTFCQGLMQYVSSVGAFKMLSEIDSDPDEKTEKLLNTAKKQIEEAASLLAKI